MTWKLVQCKNQEDDSEAVSTEMVVNKNKWHQDLKWLLTVSLCSEIQLTLQYFLNQNVMGIQCSHEKNKLYVVDCKSQLRYNAGFVTWRLKARIGERLDATIAT
jgi:hypothetical protein